MLISSAANAAEALAPGEETRFYDDIGCLASDPAAGRPGVRRFVQEADAAGWLDADAAYFAFSESVSTPMAHGVLAYASEPKARAADRDGRARTWADVVRSMEAR